MSLRVGTNGMHKVLLTVLSVRGHFEIIQCISCFFFDFRQTCISKMVGHKAQWGPGVSILSVHRVLLTVVKVILTSFGELQT